MLKTSFSRASLTWKLTNSGSVTVPMMRSAMARFNTKKLNEVFRFRVGFHITAHQISKLPGTVMRVKMAATTEVVTDVANGAQQSWQRSD